MNSRVGSSDGLFTSGECRNITACGFVKRSVTASVRASSSSNTTRSTGSPTGPKLNKTTDHFGTGSAQSNVSCNVPRVHRHP
ncbi:hypothetical protein SRHO_G00193520 [Serrasalmus rhombeus]